MQFVAMESLNHQGLTGSLGMLTMRSVMAAIRIFAPDTHLRSLVRAGIVISRSVAMQPVLLGERRLGQMSPGAMEPVVIVSVKDSVVIIFQMIAQQQPCKQLVSLAEGHALEKLVMAVCQQGLPVLLVALPFVRVFVR